MLDIITKDNECLGAVIRLESGLIENVIADATVLAAGGIGGFIVIQLISDILQVMRLQLRLSIMLQLRTLTMCRFIRQHFILRMKKTEAFLYQSQ